MEASHEPLTSNQHQGRTMTAQNHPQNDECRDQAATGTDPLGPITLPTRLRIGARALALSGVVGVAAAAVVIGTDPNTVTITTTTC